MTYCLSSHALASPKRFNQFSRLPFQVTVVLSCGGMPCFRTSYATLQSVLRHPCGVAVVVSDKPFHLQVLPLLGEQWHTSLFSHLSKLPTNNLLLLYCYAVSFVPDASKGDILCFAERLHAPSTLKPTHDKVHWDKHSNLEALASPSSVATRHNPNNFGFCSRCSIGP